MRTYPANPKELLASFWRNRELIKALTKREILGRYKGSAIGLLWSFVNPIFMLAVYTFVFGVVFKARWNIQASTKSEFALVLFSGLMVFSIFSECISRAPTQITSNTNYVKKVVFPLEILSWVNIGSALFHFTMSFMVWLIAYAAMIGIPHPNILLLPFTLLPLVLLAMGLSWVLASLGVYIRDIGQFTGLMITILMFMTPIFYPASALPTEYQLLIHLNPLTSTIEMTRGILLWRTLPDLRTLGITTLAAASFAWFGFYWFQKTRKGFADVL